MLGRTWAMVLRYLLIYRRSASRCIDLIFWPAMDLLMWGFVTRYLEGLVEQKAVSFFLGGLILWDVFFRAQQAVSLGILQEMWVGNLLNIFVSPIRMGEFLAATAVIGLFRAIITTAVLGVMAYLLYAFNVLLLSWSIIPLFALLLLFGWAMGILTTALILRYGEAVENLAWAIPFMLQPICAVFYPTSVLPEWMRVVAYSVPCTYLFDGMRNLLKGTAVEPMTLLYAATLSLIYLLAALLFFGKMLNSVKEKGYLTRGARN